MPDDFDILKSIDESALNSPLAPVCDRYYEQRFCTDINKNPDEDFCLNFHSNKICLISLAPRHPILAQKKKIKRLTYDVDDSGSRTENKALGKRKKGAQKMLPESTLCNIECEDGTKYHVQSCVKGKLLEINEALLKDPNLLVERPRSEGYLALLLPELKFSNTNFWKESFLTLEQYNETKEC